MMSKANGVKLCDRFDRRLKKKKERKEESCETDTSHTLMVWSLRIVVDGWHKSNCRLDKSSKTIIPLPDSNSPQMNFGAEKCLQSRNCWQTKGKISLLKKCCC